MVIAVCGRTAARSPCAGTRCKAQLHRESHCLGSDRSATRGFSPPPTALALSQLLKSWALERRISKQGLDFQGPGLRPVRALIHTAPRERRLSGIQTARLRVGLNGGLLTNALQGSQRLFLFVSSVTALCTGSPLPHLLGSGSRHPLSELVPLPEPSRQADSLHACGFHSFRQALVILGEATEGSCRECCWGVRWLRDVQGQSLNCRGNNSSSRSGCEQVSGACRAFASCWGRCITQSRI